MPEPAITFALHEKFIDASGITEKEAKTKALRELLGKLPIPNRLLLGVILEHCKRVAALESQNKMGIKNLAMVLSPTLLYSKEPSVLTMVEDMEKATMIIRFLIEEFEAFQDLLAPEKKETETDKKETKETETEDKEIKDIDDKKDAKDEKESEPEDKDTKEESGEEAEKISDE